MDAFDCLILILHCRGDANLGRIAIQKLVYLAGRKIPTLDIPPYKMQYYGPFSEKLGRTLERLISTSFVVEAMTPGGHNEAYGYALSGDGIYVARTLEAQPEFVPIKSFMAACQKTCGFDVAALSYASKILYLMDDRTYQQAVSDARESDWRLYGGDVEAGIDTLGELGLARR